MTLRPLAEKDRRKRFVYEALFIAFGLIGVSCVVLAAMSAVRQEALLRAELAGIRSAQASTSAGVHELGRQTQALANRPVRVTVTAPKEPEAKITWSEKRVSPTYKDAPYAVRVTVRADRQLIQPDIEVECNSAIAYADCDMLDFGYSGEEISGRKLKFTILDPKLSPRHPWTFVLSGKNPIHVVAVRKTG